MLEELRKIHELLAAKPAPPTPKGLRAEFKAFLESYKVLGARALSFFKHALIKPPQNLL